MAHWDEGNYTPREGRLFEVFAGEYAGSVKRWDEIKDAYWNQLLRNPYIGEPVEGTPYYVQDLYSDPPLSVYYEIHEEERVVEFVGIYPLGPPQ